MTDSVHPVVFDVSIPPKPKTTQQPFRGISPPYRHAYIYPSLLVHRLGIASGLSRRDGGLKHDDWPRRGDVNNLGSGTSSLGTKLQELQVGQAGTTVLVLLKLYSRYVEIGTRTK
jgi:hypothetical protein